MLTELKKYLTEEITFIKKIISSFRAAKPHKTLWNNFLQKFIEKLNANLKNALDEFKVAYLEIWKNVLFKNS